MGQLLGNSKILNYKEHLSESMRFLSEDHNYIFVGQGAEYGGHGMAPTLDFVPTDKKIELPVFEETQTGLALGMALQGMNVVSMYPRFDFFVSGASQLINHADKILQMSMGRFNPNLIYRVAVGSKVPIDAGPQHTNDYSDEFSSMLTSINVVKLDDKNKIQSSFKSAVESGGIHLFVEYYERYGD